MTKLNWRDASKELPKDGTHCLAIDSDIGIVIVCYFNDVCGWESDIDDSINYDIKYWLPLNEIPLPKE